jgi:hypothetical protein
MIPMLRVFCSEYLRGISEWGWWRPVAVRAKKMDPSGPRALLVLWTGPLRYLIEVSILVATPS